MREEKALPTSAASGRKGPDSSGGARGLRGQLPQGDRSPAGGEPTRVRLLGANWRASDCPLVKETGTAESTAGPRVNSEVPGTPNHSRRGLLFFPPYPELKIHGTLWSDLIITTIPVAH